MYQPTTEAKPTSATGTASEPVKKTSADNTAKEFVNDFTLEDKGAIRDFVSKTVNDILGLSVLTINDLTHLACVGHGSIKNRGLRTSSAREIVMGAIAGTRKPSQLGTKSVVSYIQKLSPEEKEKLLAQLTDSK